MNKKETLIWSIIDNVIVACDIPRADGTHSINKEDIVGKSREEYSGKISLTIPSTWAL